MSEEAKKPMEDKESKNTPETSKKSTETEVEVEEKKVSAPEAEAGVETAPEEKTAQKKEDKKEAVEVVETKKEDLRPGMTVRLYQKIKEGEKERVQMFEGLILSISGKNDIERGMVLRKISHGVGVEKIIPLASPTIEKIEVVRKAKVRRAKLYFLRSYGKRLKEVFVKR